MTLAAWGGSSLAAVRPAGYRDGAEDAATVPSGAVTTTAVSAWSLYTGPLTAGTASVSSGFVTTIPGFGTLESPRAVPAGTPRG
jgi:hypothetical protein